MLIPSHGIALNGPLAALSGTADVQNYQRALANLAIATQRPAINPGPTATGVVDTATMTATVAGLGLMSESLPSWAYLALQVALGAGATTATAKKAVETYAPQLTVAANTAAVKYRVAPIGPFPMQMPSWLDQFFAPGWYTRPPGMIFLGIVGYILYKKVLSKPSGGGGHSVVKTTTSTIKES